MPEVVVIDGREFAVGDYVLVEWGGGLAVVEWFAGKIASINPGRGYPINVLRTFGDSEDVYPCKPSEVHSIRENFV